MYAIFTEVNLPPGIPADAAASGLRANAVPAARAAAHQRTDSPPASAGYGGNPRLSSAAPR